MNRAQIRRERYRFADVFAQYPFGRLEAFPLNEIARALISMMARSYPLQSKVK